MGFWNEFKEAKKKAEELINAKKSQSVDMFKEAQKNTKRLIDLAEEKSEGVLDNFKVQLSVFSLC